MSATATPYGMRPVGVLGGRVNNNAFNSYKIASATAVNIFYGDVVKLTSDGVVTKDTGTATLTPIGVFVGCRFTNPTTKELTFSQYWPTGTVASDAFAYVVDDPFAVFQIQANGSLAQTTLGNNAEIVQTAGSTAIGTSKNALNAASADTTDTLPLRIVAFVDGPDSAVGDAFTDVIVKFNNHQLTTLTGV
jgi:hypothetical protein